MGLAGCSVGIHGSSRAKRHEVGRRGDSGGPPAPRLRACSLAVAGPEIHPAALRRLWGRTENVPVAVSSGAYGWTVTAEETLGS